MEQCPTVHFPLGRIVFSRFSAFLRVHGCSCDPLESNGNRWEEYKSPIVFVAHRMHSHNVFSFFPLFYFFLLVELDGNRATYAWLQLHGPR